LLESTDKYNKLNDESKKYRKVIYELSNTKQEMYLKDPENKDNDYTIPYPFEIIFSKYSTFKYYLDEEQYN
jgi:hypothetical protein